MIGRIGIAVALVFMGTGFGADTTIGGRITEYGKPVAGAMVVVQRFADEDCARMFRSKKVNQELRDKLARCSSDLPAVTTNETGHFSINVTPGIYAVRLLWLIGEEPKHLPVACEYGSDWVVAVSPARDATGKYNAMAQGWPVEVATGEQKQLQFVYDKPLGSGGKCSR